jgi:hypothetical protein
VCRNCNPSKGCWAVEKFDKCSILNSQDSYSLRYGVEEHGQVATEANMLAEIFARGPIACTICATEEFANYAGGIFEDKSGCKSLDHEVAIEGWGEENGVKYWIGRNSVMAICLCQVNGCSGGRIGAKTAGSASCAGATTWGLRRIATGRFRPRAGRRSFNTLIPAPFNIKKNRTTCPS